VKQVPLHSDSMFLTTAGTPKDIVARLHAQTVNAG
jgi:hypothetical protein